MTWEVRQGDALTLLREMPAESVRCCVTSPPYWGGLRDYGHEAQLGQEREPAAYVAAQVEVFREVRRVLHSEGTLWLNSADVYAASGKGGGGNRGDRFAWETVRERKGFRMPPQGYKMKDLVLVSFALAEALRADGWYLRNCIVWRKPSAVEPMRLDRMATSHEYLFLLSKSEHYSCRDPGQAWWGHSVWDIRTDGHAEHPAAFPAELAYRCILSGSNPGDVVLDPYAGSGTAGVMALHLGRDFIGLELNPAYCEMARRRIAGPLFAEASA